jgi:energy-converting hydrogenase Eha subunit A
MTFDVFSLLLAFGGGFFAAAIGGLHAFIFTGFLALAGHVLLFATGSSDFLGYTAFGPLFGPHIAFAGAVAAVAYAGHMNRNVEVGGEVGGKDIGVPLIQIERPDVLVVGGLFGMFGYVCQFLISKIPGFGGLTDSVALTVIISAFIARIAFGRSSIFGHLPEGAGWGRFAPRDDAAWVRWHERFVPNTILGFVVGLLAAGVCIKLAALYPEWGSNGSAYTLIFGLSAMSLLFLSLGLSFPVTHHITIIGALAGLKFLPIIGNHPIPAMIIGGVAGMFSAWFAEFFARLWHDHGNTHIDPPAAAIWPMTLIVNGLALLFASGATT